MNHSRKTSQSTPTPTIVPTMQIHRSNNPVFRVGILSSIVFHSFGGAWNVEAWLRRGDEYRARAGGAG